MYKKNLNFKPIIFKVFYTYLGVYFLALVFKYTYDIESLLNSIQFRYLIIFNVISIFFGLPLSIIFDFILLKIYGLNYVLFFSPALAFLSVIQVLILRRIKFKFYRNVSFLKKTEKNYFYKFFENVTFKYFYILIIRSFPILPHVFGSYIIASSKLTKRVISINTLLGSFLYYLLLYLIVN